MSTSYGKKKYKNPSEKRISFWRSEDRWQVKVIILKWVSNGPSVFVPFYSGKEAGKRPIYPAVHRALFHEPSLGLIQNERQSTRCYKSAFHAKLRCALVNMSKHEDSREASEKNGMRRAASHRSHSIRAYTSHHHSVGRSSLWAAEQNLRAGSLKPDLPPPGNTSKNTSLGCVTPPIKPWVHSFRFIK